MLLDAIVKLHDKVGNEKLGAQRRAQIVAEERARLAELPLVDLPLTAKPG
jgi:NADH-quinone oxidoreductase subunit B